MKPLPDRLQRLVSTLESLEREDRIEILIEAAGQFTPVPERIARRPFAAEHRVPGCESEAYVWSEAGPADTLSFHFAVENPQGISAMALAEILRSSLSGAPLDEVAAGARRRGLSHLRTRTLDGKIYGADGHCEYGSQRGAAAVAGHRGEAGQRLRTLGPDPVVQRQLLARLPDRQPR